MQQQIVATRTDINNEMEAAGETGWQKLCASCQN